MAPTVKRGLVTTQTDLTNLMLDVSDAIDQLSPDETPMLDLIGKDSLWTACTQLTHEWLEDELKPRAGTLGAAYVAGSGSLQVAAGEGKYLLPDDTILVGDTVLRVTGGAPSGDVLAVSVIGSSVDAAAASGATWTKLAHAAQEAGMARTDSAKTVVARPFNYTQIFKDWTSISGTMKNIRRYGYASEWSYQVEKLLKSLAIDFELAALYGIRSSVIDNGTRKSTMGGLFDYIYLAATTAATQWPTVMDALGADLTETLLNDCLQYIWEKGGYPDTVMVNGYNKRVVNSWGSPRIRTGRDEKTAGNTIATYESDYGDLSIMKNRWLRKGDVVILTKSEIGIGPLTGRMFSSRMLPTTQDGDWYEILGEYTMEVHKPTVCHGWIYNTSYK